jgi:hypothetical protein
MATIIKVDGTEVELKSYDLEALQKVVGGYIEGFPIGKRFMYVNENGKAEGLKLNERATEIFQNEYGDDDDIRGDVVLLTEEEHAAEMAEE